MATKSVPFTASGVLETALEEDEVMGLVYTGFTSVTVYNGGDNTGDVILAGGTGPQSILSNFPIKADQGVFVEVAGDGSGSVLV